MKKLKYFTVVGGAAVLALGAAAHFFYEWSNNNPIIGLFSPVNESVWEHMKLVFFPMLFYSIIAFQCLKNTWPCITSALPSGILTGTLLIPVIFYIYTRILRKNYFLLDILTFIISVISGFYVTYKRTVSCKAKKYTCLLWIMTGMFIVIFFICSF